MRDGYPAPHPQPCHRPPPRRTRTNPRKNKPRPAVRTSVSCQLPDLNRGHSHFQCDALPTELSWRRLAAVGKSSETAHGVKLHSDAVSRRLGFAAQNDRTSPSRLTPRGGNPRGAHRRRAPCLNHARGTDVREVAQASRLQRLQTERPYRARGSQIAPRAEAASDSLQR